MWIPAFAGMTEYLNVDSRLSENDGASLRGDNVAGVVARVCGIGLDLP